MISFLFYIISLYICIHILYICRNTYIYMYFFCLDQACREWVAPMKSADDKIKKQKKNPKNKQRKTNSVKERRIRFRVFQARIIWQLVSARKGHWSKQFLRQYCKQFYCVKRGTKTWTSARFYTTTHLRQETPHACKHPEKRYQCTINEKQKCSFASLCPNWCTCWQLSFPFFSGKLKCLCKKWLVN